MASTTYVIPTDRMTLTDEKQHRHACILAGLKVAVLKSWATQEDYDLFAGKLGLNGQPASPTNLGVVQTPKSVDIRELQPTFDAVAALDSWTTAVNAAVNAWVALPAGVAAFVVPGNRVWVFYKVGCETVPPPISRIRFQVGAGNIRGIFDLEPLWTHDVMEGYFSEPMIYATPEQVTITVRTRLITGLAAIVPLGAVVIETGGGQVA